MWVQAMTSKTVIALGLIRGTRPGHSRAGGKGDACALLLASAQPWSRESPPLRGASPTTGILRNVITEAPAFKHTRRLTLTSSDYARAHGRWSGSASRPYPPPWVPWSSEEKWQASRIETAQLRASHTASG